jgi:CHAT domain-containing protein/tetratricopeptide (TPR) repeat protein
VSGPEDGQKRSTSRGVASGNGDLAGSYEVLGKEAERQQDFNAAEKYYLHALEIDQKQDPNSLRFADVLSNLGQVAGNRGELTRAAKYHRQALTIRQQFLPNSLPVAETLNRLGNVEVARGDLGSAERHLQRSLAIRQKLAPESRMVALSLIGLGNLSSGRGDIARQETYIGQALRLKQTLLPQDMAEIFDSMGNISMRRGNFAAAEEYFAQALAIWRQQGPEGLGIAMTLNSVGNLALTRGDIERGEDHLEHALEIRRKLAPESLPFAASLSSLGALAQQRGNLARAEEYFRQGLKIRQTLAPDSLAVADSLFQLGVLFWIREDLPKAEKYLFRAEEMKRRLAPGSPSLAQSLNWLGLVSNRRGDFAQAEAYFREALGISESFSPVNLGTAEALGGLGGAASNRGNLAEAERYYQQVLQIQDQLSPDSPSKAFTLERLGNLAQRRQDFTGAERYFRQVLAIREKKVPGSIAHANALFALASVLRRQQQLDAAERFFADATAVVESQASQLGGTEDERSVFRARYEAQYKEYIELLLQRKEWELAFDVMERSRARSLLELLANAHLDIRNGCAPELLKRERLLREAISLKSNYRVRLLNDAHTEKQIEALDQQIAELRDQYDEIEEQIRIESPTYAGLTQPQPLSVKQVQQDLLDDNTVLLEYSLGDSRSHVWVVSDNALAVYDLPSRKIIEKAAWGLYESLTEQTRKVDAERIAERQARLARASKEYANAAAELSRMVLGPIAARLDKKRLIVVSDGALQYVPFAALPEPSGDSLSSANSAEQKTMPAAPLVMEHEIVYLPSASVLAELRRAEKSRKRPPMEVAVFADPVFDKHDERITAAPKAQNRSQAQSRCFFRDISKRSLASSYEMPQSASRSRGGQYFPRLLWTSREAAAILKVTPAGRGMEALGFQASRTTATSPLLAQYRIVHFATHAVMNSEHPELSGLVLSLVDEHGQPQDGFLDLEQIYNLNLPADMVVLSACDTGLGRPIDGEGLIGMARGFMYAGASRVVATLWNVEDEVTAELMARFYKGLEQDKLSPAAALRRAQMEIARQKRWNSPFYWAGFQLEGEWK